MPTAGEPFRHCITHFTLDPLSPDLTIGGFPGQPTAGEPFRHCITHSTLDPLSPDLTIGGFHYEKRR